MPALHPANYVRRYDAADVASHVYRQLANDGYQGLPIHNLYRDEVQASALLLATGCERAVPVCAAHCK